uniref:Putative integral membrane protein n=2 Tax=Rhodococcus hoagii TaxID=43767 RepID=B4F373_RHOHA|nr:hypothetical protein [Prescottella equi]ARX59604.1 putative integral membrane protein [Prescottella equi]ARX60590.1 putative integral membrane protein [Prescottella equi]ARX60695.1 putative integral membrane protein [Prescottella equi]CAQ30348.1 putative integral membrane protein [Prescottella equi]
MNRGVGKAFMEYEAECQKLETRSPLLRYLLGAWAIAILAWLFQLIARDADLDGAKVPAQILVILSLILVVGVGVAICVERIRTHRRCNQLEKAAFAVEEDPHA